MSKYKNNHYKSSIQFYSTVEQDITVDDTAQNPLTVAIGTTVTDTGVALDQNGGSVNIECGGLYRIHASAVIDGTATGDISFGLTVNGFLMPETLKTVSLVTGIGTEVSTETVRLLNTCCSAVENTIGIVAYSDGTATGTIDNISGNIVKLA